MLNELKKIIDNNWLEFFDSYIDEYILDEIFSKIGISISEKQNISLDDLSNYYFPIKDNIFRFMKQNLKSVKCIIVGMEPYSSYYILDNKIYPIATGRSFEVANVISWKQKFKQTSLMQILKTLYFDKTNTILPINEIREKIVELSINDDINQIKNILKNDILYIYNMRDWFNYVENNGVMWLNATLTCKPKVSDSHTFIWEEFMEDVFKYMCNFFYKNNQNVFWLIWGKNAYDRVIKYVNKKNIIYSCHPATRVNNNFVESNCFKYIKNIKWYL